MSLRLFKSVDNLSPGTNPIQNLVFACGLARGTQNFVRGSLIPRPTFVGGKTASQSASRGKEVVSKMQDE